MLSENEGYMYKSSTPQTLIYPESSLYGSNSLRLISNPDYFNKWNLNPNKFENSMNIVAKIDENNLFEQNSKDIIGTFNKSDVLDQLFKLR